MKKIYNDYLSEKVFYTEARLFFTKLDSGYQNKFFQKFFTELKKKFNKEFMFSEDVLLCLEEIVGKEKLSEILKIDDYINFIEKSRLELVEKILDNEDIDLIEKMKKNYKWFYNDKTKEMVDSFFE
ncbi:MAG: hypothetical protein M0R46_03035 [Candidatus Muirbacterium halophilum]|nr:hypothetical protein [Candidatus Muirbacterium halophilum]MCK9474865.1 hypothetical protein [Candidatus Muirbacterium halophilum]